MRLTSSSSGLALATVPRSALTQPAMVARPSHRCRCPNSKQIRRAVKNSAINRVRAARHPGSGQHRRRRRRCRCRSGCRTACCPARRQRQIEEQVAAVGVDDGIGNRLRQLQRRSASTSSANRWTLSGTLVATWAVLWISAELSGATVNGTNG